MVKHLLIPIVAVAFAGGVCAQENTPPSEEVVASPMVEGLPESISFSKRFVYKPRKVAPDDEEGQKLARFLELAVRPLEVDIVKTGEVTRERIRFTNNSSVERWRSGSYRFEVKSSDPSHIRVFVSGVNSEDESISDFSELAWVRHASLLGEQTKNGVKCRVYRHGENTVWIEPVSRLPVQLEGASMQVTYRYKSAPEQALVLPERYLRRLERVQRAWAGQSD